MMVNNIIYLVKLIICLVNNTMSRMSKSNVLYNQQVDVHVGFIVFSNVTVRPKFGSRRIFLHCHENHI